MAKDNTLSLCKQGFDSPTDDMIKFEVDKSKMTQIDPKIVAAANERIRKAMIPIVRDFKKKSKLSELRAAKILVL